MKVPMKYVNCIIFYHNSDKIKFVSKGTLAMKFILYFNGNNKELISLFCLFKCLTNLDETLKIIQCSPNEIIYMILRDS